MTGFLSDYIWGFFRAHPSWELKVVIESQLFSVFPWSLGKDRQREVSLADY